MRDTPRWSAKQSTVVLAVLVAAACATQMEQPEDEGTIVPGTPMDTGGTQPMGTGGSLDAMMGTGGTLPMGGAMSVGGNSGAGGMGKGGTGMGGKAGSGTGGANAMGGKGGSSAGMTMMPGAGRGGATMGSGGKAGGSTMGGAGMGSGGRAGGSGGIGSGGRGSGGMTMAGGRSSSGGASAGGSAGSGSGQACPNPLDPDQPGATQGNSGSFMTKAAVCYFVEGSFNAWDCSNLADRMVTVNGKAGACGAALPAKVNGGYYFAFTASATTDYTSFFWYTQ